MYMIFLVIENFKRRERERIEREGDRKLKAKFWAKAYLHNHISGYYSSTGISHLKKEIKQLCLKIFTSLIGFLLIFT